ncbi:hypothetical protein C4D60_Mb09t15460 [Musa balbisiana]|uniref:Uncharacterized protein n=1 Tax=Musa balbisiana TaxID=52838 RepID=A0A4S8IGQ8_MUSBA|nr:hypothetical protein C4D60_Mb09t15460 [Musa balbisiana]
MLSRLALSSSEGEGEIGFDVVVVAVLDFVLLLFLLRGKLMSSKAVFFWGQSCEHAQMAILYVLDANLGFTIDAPLAGMSQAT